MKNLTGMKKLAVMALSLLAALALCATALANTAALELYDSATELLFNTDNVTLKAHAEFSLDGTWFKTVDGEWQQDGARSFRQLLLTSPKMDGTERKNGYTILTDKNDLWLMEVYTPGYYRKGFDGDRTSLLRNTTETNQLIALGKALASQADLFLGADAITKAEDGSWRVSLGENTPDIVNAALNQLARFAAKRYFEVDYDMIPANQEWSMSDFGTVSKGLLYTMRGLSLRNADITLKPDEKGNLSQAEGTVSLAVETAGDGVKQLDVTFSVEISDRGTTSVKRFKPADYNVAPVSEDEYGVEFGTVVESPSTLQLLLEMFMEKINH